MILIHATKASSKVDYLDQSKFNKALFSKKKKCQSLPEDYISDWQNLYMRLREEERQSVEEFVARNYRTFHM